MNTNPITPETLAQSVISVPPLARAADETISRLENEKMIRYLETGGVTTLLYGGNAVLYHVAISEYAELLGMLVDTAAEDTLMIPSVGPAYGTMMDQAAILREFDFPTAMVLPTRDVCTPTGVASAVRRFVEAIEKPAVLYIKHDGFIDVENVKRLMDDQLLSWVKYAVVRDDTSSDDYLRSLVDTVGSSRVVSGIGEQPATIHLRDFGLQSFTSGCVCAAPRMSMNMLRALKSGDVDEAESIREKFVGLEDLRNSINPVRVLHTAMTLSGIANMGPLRPLLSEVDESQSAAIESAVKDLVAIEQDAAVEI